MYNLIQIKTSISKMDVIFIVAGVIYKMHPYNKPENMDKIIDAINDLFIEYGNDYIDVDFKEFIEKLKNKLFDTLEFRQLNISKALKDAGVKDTNDERNKGITFISRYTNINTDNFRYNDFTDLDACISNIRNGLNHLTNIDSCFLCKYAKEYGSTGPGNDICKTCINNPNFTNRRIPHPIALQSHPIALKPQKDWTDEEKKKYKLE